MSRIVRLFETRNGCNGTAHNNHDAVQTALEEKQELLAHFVRLVARKVSFGLFVAGTGGSGKSLTISRVLAEEGVCPILLNSHITPMSLYQALYEFRQDQIIWLDDMDGCYSSLPVLGLLRSALWGQGERIVTYSSTAIKGMPNRFVFDSRLVMCANVFPKNEAFRAVLSRIDTFELSLTNEETLEQMRVMAARGFGSLTTEQCLEVVEFIEKAGGTRQLSMRLWEPSLRKVEFAISQGLDWRSLVRCQLDQIGAGENPKPLDSRAHDLNCMAQAVVAHPENVQRQQEFWCRATGKSRASFFRTKRAYEQRP